MAGFKIEFSLWIVLKQKLNLYLYIVYIYLHTYYIVALDIKIVEIHNIDDIETNLYIFNA